MNDFLSKLSSYHLFNYLVPGVVFGVLARPIIPYSVGPHDIATWAFLAYFLGLVVSRIGSLVVEPVLRCSKFMPFWDYKELSNYSKDDPHLSVLYEVSNMYRTVASGFLLLLVLKVYVNLEARCPVLQKWDATILAVLLLVMFLFAYKKQTEYMIERIDLDKKNTGKAQPSAVD
jgi:hypothetical protein